MYACSVSRRTVIAYMQVCSGSTGNPSATSLMLSTSTGDQTSSSTSPLCTSKLVFSYGLQMFLLLLLLCTKLASLCAVSMTFESDFLPSAGCSIWKVSTVEKDWYDISKYTCMYMVELMSHNYIDLLLAFSVSVDLALVLTLNLLNYLCMYWSEYRIVLHVANL